MIYWIMCWIWIGLTLYWERIWSFIRRCIDKILILNNLLIKEEKNKNSLQSRKQRLINKLSSENIYNYNTLIVTTNFNLLKITREIEKDDKPCYLTNEEKLNKLLYELPEESEMRGNECLMYHYLLWP